MFAFEDLYRHWKQEAFEIGAFGLEQDFNAYLDDPETGAGDEIFDEFADEIMDFEFPCKRG